MPAKKNKMIGLSLPLFQNKSKSNRSPALAFVFSNKQPKSCFVYKWETFFSLYFSFTRKQSSQQTNCFFFVNKTILKWETETKQKRSWTGPSVFLLILFAFCHPRQNKKRRFYKSEETIVRTTHSLCLKFEKLFSAFIVVFFELKLFEIKKKSKLFLKVISNNFRFYVHRFFFLRNAI